MGLCASQARLLMLTARKSDLEFQIQQISQARMVLAQNQDTVAQKYSDALNNKKLEIRQEDGDMVNLTPATLMEAGYGFTYNGVDYYPPYDSETIRSVLGNSIEEVGEDNNIFQRLLMSGRITLLEPQYGTTTDEETGETTKAQTGWTETSYSGTNDIHEVFYTEDDAAAKAEYDSDMSKLQNKDKTLELEADRIETEHNAIQTEIESVESVIKKNIETSYKIFAES